MSGPSDEFSQQPPADPGEPAEPAPLEGFEPPDGLDAGPGPLADPAAAPPVPPVGFTPGPTAELTGLGDLPPDGPDVDLGATLPAAPPPPAMVAARQRDALPAATKVVGHRTPGQLASTVGRRYLWVVGVVVIATLVVNLMPSARGTTTSSSSATSQSSSVVVPAGVTPPNRANSAGTTVGGVACGPGVRQVPWSAYAPECQPAWHGNNGGATFRGVTKTTITVAYRAASTAQLAQLYGLLPPSVVGTNAEAEHTLQAYINTFNRSFELYGRHVVLVPFTGKGDFIQEDLGQDQSQAQQDAVTESTSIKAFADASGIDASALYASDLGAQHVVTSSLYENPASWYQANAPWEYSPGPNCTKMAQATGAILGKQLGGLPASFAGSADLRSKTRSFGIIYPLNPQAAQCEQEDAAAMAHYGYPVKAAVSVKFDLSSLIAAGDQAVAEMKSAGVTTVILSSADPISPKFFLQAADADNYYPEWWFQSYFAGGLTNNDSFTRVFPADQINDMLGIGSQTQPKQLQEAITAYNMGNTTPGVKPLPSYFWSYENLMQIFDALQLAGPDLTPANFEAAMNEIPQSKSWGMLMGWNGATGPYDAGAQFHVVKYDPNRRSPLDGKLGSYIACDNNAAYAYSSDGAGVPSHTQLVCAPAPVTTPNSS